MPPPTISSRPLELAPVRGRPVAGTLRPVGRFVLHLLEMCMVMCAGALVLSVVFFGAAGLLGYTNLPQRAPELSVLVIAINLSVPMAAWMRFRGMTWRPTLEMSGSTMVFGLLLIAAYWMGIVAEGSLIEVQTGLACPLMLVVMLVRPRLYASSHTGHYGHSAPDRAPFPRGFARFNRKFANPVVRKLAGSLGPLAIVRHRGRRTGRDYATPVLAFGSEDGLVVGVLYGTTSDWVSNVLAARRAEVEWHGQSHDYGQPRLVTGDEGLRLVPTIVRGPFRLLGVHDFLCLTATQPHDLPA